MEVRDGRLVLLKLPEIDLIDDKEAKPVVQKFSVGWDEALAKGWTVVSMQKDWHAIFPPAQK